MSAATIPLPAKRITKTWQPTSRDRLIFRWVKLEGMTQSWVSDQFGLHQTTVSRIIERYERWVARGGPGRDGELKHEERVRYQRWMTYQRNELILASALRLADEMQRGGHRLLHFGQLHQLGDGGIVEDNPCAQATLLRDERRQDEREAAIDVQADALGIACQWGDAGQRAGANLWFGVVQSAAAGVFTFGQ